MRISICNFSKLKALCKIFEKTLHDDRPFRVVNGLDRDQSRLISRTPAILLWKLSQESLDNISLISRLNQQVEWGYKRNKKERRCWYCSKITPIFCPGNGPPVPTDMICQSYSIQCKKHRLCQRVDLKTKWNRWGQDETNCTRSSSIQCQFIFSKGAVRGKISNSKNWLEDKMGQDEINCTGFSLFPLSNLLLSWLFFL